MASSNAVPDRLRRQAAARGLSCAGAAHAGQRLAGPDERAHELAVHARRDGRRVDPLAVEEFAGVLGPVDPRRLHVDRLEAGLAELAAILAFLERARHAADPQLDAAADHGRHLAPYHDVRDGEPAAGLQDAERLGEHAVLVGRQVDDAVRDDHVHGVVGQRDGLDLALEELDVAHAGLALVLARQGEHLVGHVEAVRLAGGPDAPGRQQHVDAAARAEIEHGLARLQLGERGGVPTAQRRRHRLLRQLRRLAFRIEIGGHGVTRRGAAAARAAAARHAQGRLSVLLLHELLDAVIGHGAPSSNQESLMVSAKKGAHSQRGDTSRSPFRGFLRISRACIISSSTSRFSV